MTYNPLKKNDSIILLVNDDLDDLYLCTQALNAANPALRVLTSPDGKSAIEHLIQAHTSNILPALIIMGLHMPKMNGMDDVLEIKNHKQLAHIPIIIITETPTDEQQEYFDKFDIKMVRKPASFEQLLQKLDIVLQHYSTINNNQAV